MGGLTALSFIFPWAFIGLTLLPFIWWLLRVSPSAPRRILFPPILLLQRISTQRQTPMRMPFWLLLLRLVLVVLIVFGIAGPLWNADLKFKGEGPVYIIIDDGWSASNGWQVRKSTLRDIVEHADRESRQVVLTTTAPIPEDLSSILPQILTAPEASEIIDSLQPKPWSTDRLAAVERLLSNESIKKNPAGDVIWLSDGLEETNLIGKTVTGFSELVRRVGRLGSVTIFSGPDALLPVVLLPPKSDGGELHLAALRASVRNSRGIQIKALSEDGEVLGHIPLIFSTGVTKATGKIDIPIKIRNKLSRLEISGSRNIGGVVLMDERWRYRPVGLLTVARDLAPQPLLDSLNYLIKAISPFTEVRKGSAADLVNDGLAVLIIADPGRLKDAEIRGIQSWIARGGVLLRFAGPRLARDLGSFDPLLPVKLRPGGRVIGGALSWQKPEKLAPFSRSSPFFDIAIPEDVRIHRQVLAEPSLDLNDKTWARLTDGTPLVTADRRGKGWVILVHTTANAEWSNLSLSGLYVRMLRRLISLSDGFLGNSGTMPLSPIFNLNAFGEQKNPTGSATAINPKAFENTRVSSRHPPGLYGTPMVQRALNLTSEQTLLNTFRPLPPNISQRTYAKSQTLDFRPWLFGLAALIFILDLIISIWARGLFRTRALGGGLAIFVALFPAAAVTADEVFAINNSLQTRMAFVITGDEEIDRISEAGLTGLNLILWRRTAAELGDPQGINLAVDELSFFPLIYWPILPDYILPAGAGEHVVEYLRNGGVILFDTQDQGSSGTGNIIVKLSQELEIPPLVPLPPDHVLTKSFYLLEAFPGRWSGGTLWVEKAGERVNDGVSPVIAGSNNWSAAWAIDEKQRPIFPVVPGGERQRELAYRFGINLVMYTLTGNYKADQVHMPAIIERLGR